MNWQRWRHRLKNIAVTSFDLHGRLGLLDFFIFFVGLSVVFTGARALSSEFVERTFDPTKGLALNDPFVALAMPPMMTLCFLSVARRLHDRNWSSWILAPVCLYTTFVLGYGMYAPGVPDALTSNWVFAAHLLVMAIMLPVTVQMFLPGTRGPNRFGPDPRDLY